MDQTMRDCAATRVSHPVFVQKLGIPSVSKPRNLSYQTLKTHDFGGRIPTLSWWNPCLLVKILRVCWIKPPNGISKPRFPLARPCVQHPSSIPWATCAVAPAAKALCANLKRQENSPTSVDTCMCVCVYIYIYIYTYIYIHIYV